MNRTVIDKVRNSMKKFYCAIASLFLCTSCTVSIIMTDTHGTAEDVVDSTPTTETKTDATVDLPTTL